MHDVENIFVLNLDLKPHGDALVAQLHLKILKRDGSALQIGDHNHVKYFRRRVLVDIENINIVRS